MREKKSRFGTGCFLGCAAAVAIVLAVGTFVTVKYIAPTLGPLMDVQSAIREEYPDTAPEVVLQYHNGVKNLQVKVDLDDFPEEEGRQRETAENIARIVRESYDLEGYSEIVVVIENRVGIDAIHFTEGAKHRFPARD